MTEIGASLREARMRAKLDISEVEADTKIRGKYLRALENEEWSLLPGPTFVRSFLRTYGDYLGLDGRMLVEEFKLRYEAVGDRDLPPIGAPRNQNRDRGRRPPSRGRGASGEGHGRAWLVAGLIAVLVAGLFILGTCGTDDKKGDAVAPATTTTAGSARAATLRIVPHQPVYACLRAADGRRLIDGVVLQPGAVAQLHRGTTLRLGLGTGSATLVVNGTSLRLQESAAPRGYVITREGLRRVPAAERVTCR